MNNFHQFLDSIFKQRLSFSVFFRIWLAFALLISLATGLATYQLQKTIKPSAQRVVEDTLVDISRILAVALNPAVVSGQIYQPDFQMQFAQSFAPFDPERPQFPIWYDQKTQSQLHVYVTDKRGIVIYDSQQQAVGKDFSRWNDVYLTLKGQYGARSTKQDPTIADSSIMYVASPIRNSKNELIGVVSVGKPVLSLRPYIELSRAEIIKTMLYITGLGLLFAGLMAWWLRHSVQAVNRYTQNLANDTPPHFYLGKELNELVNAIHVMKNTIENKAYVTDYVHTLTHELKSPLTAIRASGELLAEAMSTTHRQQFSQTILQQSDKLQTLVEKLLIIAKLEQPTFKLNLQKYSLTPLIKQSIANQHARIKQKNLQICSHISENNTLLLDKFWLQQALQNVIDNAIKFSQSCIVIMVFSTPTGLCIDVLNDSEMLPDYVLEKAFERYFSVDIQPNPNDSQSPTHRQNKGTGLGLTLVKQVIERHHGRVTFDQLTVKNYQEQLVNRPTQPIELPLKKDANLVKLSIYLPI
ncbi:two-component system sensor histidine kinase CreC [Faucicola boevrei]|uniref:two-component system sensor histidine kinase CreC n=1 Tax=Faucicola boevrei TaxID=346665 RepID=UPI0003736574|nr:two-component system sensor histidine kinase CreC [Moraxella boevrei]